MNNEKQPNLENNLDKNELDRLADERLKAAAEQLESRSPERSSAEKADSSRHEALEQAKSSEKERRNSEKQPDRIESKPDLPVNSKAARKEAFGTIMTEVQSQMSPAERTFSKFIHAPVVEKVSDVTSKTIARPNAILAGSLTAFVLVLATYLIARHYGYPLSGAETMLAFAAGWVLGVLFDFLRLMITGRHN